MGSDRLQGGVAGSSGIENGKESQGVISRFFHPTKSLKSSDSGQSTQGKGMFTHLLQKYSDIHESLVGVDIVPGHIRICQMEEHGGKYSLEKLAAVDIPGEHTAADISAYSDLYAQKLKELINKNKVGAKNAAVAIPVSSAIIKTITMPLMTDQEIEQAIEMGSFWENLVQLPGDISEYSVFYEVEKRDAQNNTMDIMFVGSRLEDIEIYAGIVSKAGLNPAVIDVRCFALSNVFHVNRAVNEGNQAEVFLKFGPDENYVHIIDGGESFMYDIYISDEERRTIMDHFSDAEIVQRYATQARQIIASHQSRQTSAAKIKDIYVVSTLPSIGIFVSKLSSVLSEFRIKECDFFEKLNVSGKLSKQIANEKSPSAWAVVMGLAARKLDIFEENKGVAGADNVNLLPGNEAVKKSKRVNLISTIGLVPTIAICLAIAVVSYLSVMTEDKNVSGMLNSLGQVDTQYNEKSKQLTSLKKVSEQLVALEAIKSEFSSNQEKLLTTYKHINGKVPTGLWLTELAFMAPGNLVIKGNTVNDQSVLSFIKELKDETIFTKISLKTLQVNPAFVGTTTMVKSFVLACDMTGLEGGKGEEGDIRNVLPDAKGGDGGKKIFGARRE